jgi:branched-chain amino acid transport system ATP-binding protein
MNLSLKDVNAFYGSSHILFDVNFEVEQGDSVCILGRNGVGKSTTLKSIMGLMKAKNHASVTGSIQFDGKELVKLPPYRISRAGLAYVPQGRQIFPTLTTKENLLLAAKAGPDGSSFWDIEKIYELFPNLKNRESVKGNRLSGGEQQMLAIARGLMQNPKMLLLDEITEGLAPIVVDELVEIVERLRSYNVSILLAEQNIRFAMDVSRYCYIIEKGSVVYSGETASIPHSVIEQYLGT